MKYVAIIGVPTTSTHIWSRANDWKTACDWIRETTWSLSLLKPGRPRTRMTIMDGEMADKLVCMNGRPVYPANLTAGGCAICINDKPHSPLVSPDFHLTIIGDPRPDHAHLWLRSRVWEGAFENMRNAPEVVFKSTGFYYPMPIVTILPEHLAQGIRASNGLPEYPMHDYDRCQVISTN